MDSEDNKSGAINVLVDGGHGEPASQQDGKKEQSSTQSESQLGEGSEEIEIDGEGLQETISPPWGEEEEVIWHWPPIEGIEEEIEEAFGHEEVIKEWVCGQDWSKSTVDDLIEPAVSVSVDRHGTVLDSATGREYNVHKFTLADNIISVHLIDFGATVVSVVTPDKNGVIDDILLGFDSPQDYADCGCLNFGATIGRTTGLIGKGEFLMRGKDYYLTTNYGRHHKHGGCKSFGQVMWKSYVKNDRVIMTYVSQNGEEGYPGAVFVQRTFVIPGDGTLIIETQARVSLPTPLGISSMLYFNLAGHYAGEPSLSNHILQVNADYILEENDEVPTGRYVPVTGTGYDLRSPRKLNRAFKRVSDYNSSFCLRAAPSGSKRFALRILHPKSGRFMEIETDHPALFINSCGKFPGKEPDVESTIGFPSFSSYQDVAYDKDMSTLHGSVTCPDVDVKPRFTSMPVGEPTMNEVTKKGIKFWLTPATKKDVFGETDSTECLQKSMQVSEEVEEEVEGEDFECLLGIPGKGGAMYKRRCSLAIMPCEFSDSVNNRNFPSVFMGPTKIYTRVDLYRFGVVHQRPVETETVTEKVCPPRVESSEHTIEEYDESSICTPKPSTETSDVKAKLSESERYSNPLTYHPKCQQTESYNKYSAPSREVEGESLEKFSLTT